LGGKELIRAPGSRLMLTEDEEVGEVEKQREAFLGK
jgi:hypothetical protein